jgi:antitoxin component HigA of HigAB toxin-antitoxin module
MDKEYTRIYKDEIEYKNAIARLGEIMDKPRLSQVEKDEYELIALLVEEYEKSHFPMDLPTPIAAIQFRMDQLNLKPIDLVPFIGSRGRVSEILSGKRQLSIEHIRALNVGLQIPLEVLLKKDEKLLIGKHEYHDGDWVTFISKSEEKQQARIVKIYKRYCSIRRGDGKRFAILWDNIIRKLSPSEVIVKIGCLSGTVEKAYGEEKGTFILRGLSGQRNVLWLSMLDAPTRELVKALLKAREEK